MTAAARIAIHRWQSIADVIAAHTIMLGDADLFDEAAVALLLSRIGEVRLGIPPAVGMVAMLQHFDARLDSLTLLALSGGSRLGRGSADVIATVGRIQTRDALTEFGKQALQLRRVILNAASRESAAMVPIYQNLEPVQPTTYGHFLGGLLNPLERSARMQSLALATVDLSPMGAVSGASTGLAINRNRVADLLGFEKLASNSLDAVAAVDWLQYSAEAIATTVQPLLRYLQEMALWLRADPASLRFSSSWSGTIDDLPQLEPVVRFDSLERQLQRAMTLIGEVRSLTNAAPYSPVIYLEEMLDPLLTAAREASLGLAEATELFTDGMTLNLAHLANRASRNRMTGNDLTEFLMIKAELEPSAARSVSTLLNDHLRLSGLELSGLTPAMIDEVTLATIGREVGIDVEDISRYMAPRRFLERRAHQGGPAAPSVQKYRQMAEATLEADLSQLDDFNARIASRTADLRDLMEEAQVFNPEA